VFGLFESSSEYAMIGAALFLVTIGLLSGEEGSESESEETTSIISATMHDESSDEKKRKKKKTERLTLRGVLYTLILVNVLIN
jgi:sugar phosphate permease